MATAITPTQAQQMRDLSANNPKLEGLVLGAGSLQPKFIIVAEAPGRKEIELGRGFVGPSGQELQTWLDELGVSREEIYITAAVRARPFSEKNGSKKDRPPSKAEIKAFAEFLDYELAHLQSDVIITLGNTALQRLLGPEYKVSEVHGQFLQTPLLEYDPVTQNYHAGQKIWTVIPLFHPSYVRRFAAKNRPLVAADLAKIKKFLATKI